MLKLDHVRDRLRPVEQEAPVSLEPRSRAGVAIVLAGDGASLSMCFMERARRGDDRWSGDVAFPGGWAKPHESRLRDAAMREAHEEVGLVLHQEQHIGDVPTLSIARGSRDPGVIGASVFYVGRGYPALKADPREVADAFWVSCAQLYDPANRTTVHWSRSGPPSPRPAVAIRDHVIWGLTYRVLERFSALVISAGSPLLPDSDRASSEGKR